MRANKRKAKKDDETKVYKLVPTEAGFVNGNFSFNVASNIWPDCARLSTSETVLKNFVIGNNRLQI
jgi:hypothetical protein